jgi:hypothetical protein
VPRTADVAAEREVLHRFNKAGSNVVESAAMLMGSVAAPHERWAELAGDDTTSVGEPDEGERPWR